MLQLFASFRSGEKLVLTEIDEQATTWRDRQGRSPVARPCEATQFRMTRVVLAAADLDTPLNSSIAFLSPPAAPLGTWRRKVHPKLPWS
jgi:hypothetical protein